MRAPAQLHTLTEMIKWSCNNPINQSWYKLSHVWWNSSLTSCILKMWYLQQIAWDLKIVDWSFKTTFFRERLMSGAERFRSLDNKGTSLILEEQICAWPPLVSRWRCYRSSKWPLTKLTKKPEALLKLDENTVASKQYRFEKVFVEKDCTKVEKSRLPMPLFNAVITALHCQRCHGF